NRMATGSHKFIKIKNTDVIVFSSNAIPGNEKYVTRTVDGLMREGSSVIQNDKTHLTGVGPLHVSGHGYYDDHVKLINALNPTYYLPIHGEFHMLQHNGELAEKECGIPRDNIFVCDSGDVIEITSETAKKNGRIPVGGIMYDDSGTIVSEVVLKDRIHMAGEGMFVVVLTLARGSGRLMTSPDIISRGFIYLRDSEELMNTIRQYLKQKVAKSFTGKRIDMDVMKKELKDEITHILYDQTRRTPIVIPVINEIGGGGGGGQQNRDGGGRGQGGDNRDHRDNRQQGPRDQRPDTRCPRPAPKSFPAPQVPDTEATDTKAREATDQRPY
ncbi:MAG: ribonuclease J, partial [Candidatus Saccharimonadales bacterium]